MLAGFRRQQVSRRLRSLIIDGRERVLRRFQAATGGWPWTWTWTPTQLEGWIAAGGWAHSTARSYQGAVALFCDYACDPRYGWVAECKQRIDVAPSRICHDETWRGMSPTMRAARNGGPPSKTSIIVHPVRFRVEGLTDVKPCCS